MSSLVTKSCSKTEIDLIECEHVWDIERFKLLDQSDHGKGWTLESTRFFSGFESEVKWSLNLIYDQDDSDKSLKTLNLCLQIITSDLETLNVNVSVSLQDSNGKEFRSCPRKGFTFVKKNSNSEVLLSVKKLSEIIGAISTGHKLKIVVKIDYWEYRYVDEPKEETSDASDYTCDEEATDRFVALLSDPSFSDITLKVQSREFKCHKVILASISPVFRSMFRKGKKNMVLEIENLDPVAVEETIKYMYTGKIAKLDGMTYSDDLFVSAGRYGLDKLKVLVEKQIVEEISISNAAKLLAFSDKHSAENLKESVTQFILDNVDEIRETEDWKGIIKNDANLLNHILDQVGSKKRKKEEEEEEEDEEEEEEDDDEEEEETKVLQP